MSDAVQSFLIALGSGLVAALVLVALVAAVVRLAARRWPSADLLSRRSRAPFRLLVVVVAVSAAWHVHPPTDPDDWSGVSIALRVGIILTSAWLLLSVLLVLEDQALSRYRVDVPDNRVARRLRTQVLIVRRLTVGVVVVLALGASLLSLPGVEAVGASVLASAGLVSVVAALAAQSTLGNVIAGIQIAFSDSVRYDDAVIVEGEWGWVDELTLTYVVVRLWDERRMLLPSTYFTTTPFQNWTRRTSELLGSVEMDLDWRVDTGRMREQLDVVLADTDLWDGRVKVLQVTDAVGGWVRVRILVTAQDAPTLFDLRCHVRERMIDWLQRHDEGGLPRFRVESVERTSPGRVGRDTDASGLFSGDPEAQERAARVTGQLPVVDAELP